MLTQNYDFSVGEGPYRVWLWKGDYLNLGAGAEMGIYYGGGPQWNCGTEYAMPMTLTLYYNDEQIIRWDPEQDTWWITGFNPNYQDVDATELKAFGSKDFSDHLNMWDKFYDNPNWVFVKKIILQRSCGKNGRIFILIQGR